MKFQHILSFAFLMTVAACGAEAGGQAGDACTTDADCATGLECHDHDGEMECEAHEDEDDHEDHTDDDHTDE